MVKKLIKLIIKILFTPVMILFHFITMIGIYIIMFYQWLYESSEFNKSITKKMKDYEKADMNKRIRNWFTTL